MYGVFQNKILRKECYSKREEIVLNLIELHNGKRKFCTSDQILLQQKIRGY